MVIIHTFPPYFICFAYVIYAFVEQVMTNKTPIQLFLSNLEINMIVIGV